MRPTPSRLSNLEGGGVSEKPKPKKYMNRIGNCERFPYAPILFATKRFKSMSNQSEKPPILTDTYGLRSPKAAQAGVGARTLQEIREATEAKPRLGDYHDSRSK
jgi:hypothetical protein